MDPTEGQSVGPTGLRYLYLRTLLFLRLHQHHIRGVVKHARLPQNRG